MAEEIKWKNTIDKSLYLLADMLDDKGAVGSIIITGTKDDPSIAYGLDGTWECIKKEFKFQEITDVINWNMDEVTESSKEGAIYKPLSSKAYLCDNNIIIRSQWSNKKKMDDSTHTIGTLQLSKIGINQTLPYRYYFGSYNDGHGSIGFTIVEEDGAITVNEWVSNYSQVQALKSIYATYSTQIAQYVCFTYFEYVALPPERMLDDFCQIWYWKRTA